MSRCAMNLRHADVIAALRRLTESCQDTAESTAGLAQRYAALRAEALSINDQHGWARADVLSTQFPSLDALSEIASLERATAEAPALDRSIEPATAARLTEALIELASWATGVRLAYEALDEIDSH
jgi:hypothetical protein